MRSNRPIPGPARSDPKVLFDAPHALLPSEPRIAHPAQAHALSERFLTPALAEIEALLLFVRASVDPLLSAQQPIKLGKPYPLGQCLEISKAVEQRLKALRPSDLPDASAGVQASAIHAGYRALQAYKRHGGTIRLVWGDLRGQYFQNAFLVGTYYMDVSNDTVFVTKPKVEILPLAQANFHRVEDYAHFSRVAQSYWKVQLYPNHFLPELAPFCPLVAVSEAGVVMVHCVSDYMLTLNVRQRLQPAERILQGPAAQDALGRLMSRMLADHAVALAVDAVQGRTLALKACERLCGSRQQVLAHRCLQAKRMAIGVNAKLARFRLSPQGRPEEPSDAPLDLPPPLRNTDALLSLFKAASQSARTQEEMMELAKAHWPV